MITEDYVSSETAKILKEKGFNELTPMSYSLPYGHESHIPCNNDVDTDFVSRITLQLARKWIKEKYKRHIEVRITNHSISDMVNVIRYYWIIFDAETARWMDESTIYKIEEFDTEEQAYEHALRHILENIEKYD